MSRLSMPLYHFVTGNLPETTRAPELDDCNTVRALQADAKWSGHDAWKGAGVTEELLGRYFSFVLAIGFISAPAASKKGRTLPPATLSKEQQDALSKLGGRGGSK